MRVSGLKPLLMVVVLMAAAPLGAGATQGGEQASKEVPAFPWFHGSTHPQTFVPGPEAHPYTRWMYGMMAPAYVFTDPMLYHQWATMFMNPMVDAVTRHSVLDGMMRGFDPRLYGIVPKVGEDGVPATLPAFRIAGFPTQTAAPERGP